MSPSSLPAGTHERVLGLVRALVAGLTASARAVEHRTGITNAQLFLLRELAAAGPLAVGDLAGRAQTQPSTVSIVVARLARAGLVSKSRASGDRRRVVVSVTARGRKLLTAAPVPPTARLLTAIKELPSRDAMQLMRGLSALNQRMAFAAEDPPMLFEERPARRARRA